MLHTETKEVSKLNTFGDRLKEKRTQKNLKQEDIANLLKINRVTYTNYEKGKREPSIDILIKLADIYETSIDYLTGRYN